MPTSPNRTKKALQEIARVFNKLASELTADLSEAAKEIENLRREVQRIKSFSHKPNRVSRAVHKKASGHPTRSTRPRTKPPGISRHDMKHETSKPSHETSSFVFPHEPFNPPKPPEPSSPGNN